MSDLAQTITRAAKLKARVKRTEAVLERRKALLKTEEAPILAAAQKAATPTKTGGREATLQGEGGRSVHISFPCPSLKLTPENWKTARKIAGPHFAKLAEKIAVPFQLVKSARDRASALLTPSRAAKFLKLLESENGPRFTYR